MSDLIGKQLTSVSLEVRVIRRDGRVEDLGQMAYWHRNPLRRVLWRIKQRLAGRSAGRITGV